MNIKLKTLIPTLIGIALPVVTMVATANPVKALSFSYQTQFGSFGNGNGQFDSPFGIALYHFDKDVIDLFSTKFVKKIETL